MPERRKPQESNACQSDLTAPWIATTGVTHRQDAATLAALLSLVPQFVWEASRDGQITFASAYGLRYMGLTLEQAQRGGWLQTIAPEERERVMRAWAASVARGERYEVEMPIRRDSDGQFRWHVVRAEPVRDAVGPITRWVGIALDIHEVRAATERVQLATAAGAIVGTWDWNLRTDQFTVDERFAQYFGIDPALGRSGLSLEQVIAGVHPEDLAGLRTAINEAVARGGSYSHEYRVRGLDGEYRWIQANGRVETAGDGRPLRFPGVLLDVGPRRALEAERDRANDLLRAFVEAVPGVVYAKDRAGRMLLVNQGTADLIGKPREAFLGLTDAEFLTDPAQAAAVMANDRRIMDQGRAEQLEEVVNLPDGTRAVWLSAKAPFRDASGQIVGLVGGSIDITPRKDAEERLQLAIQSSSLGWWDVDPRTFRMTWSSNARRMFDLPQEGRIDLADPIGRIHPADRPRVEASIDAVLGQQSSGTYHEVYRVIWRDGTLRWIEALGQVAFDSSAGGVGTATRFSGVVWDITEQHEAALERERLLAEASRREAEFRTLADTMPQIVWATRPDGYHDYFNERWYEYTGMPRPHEPGGEYDPTGGGQGWNWKDYLHPDDHAATFAAWARSLQSGEPYHVEYRFRRRDGAWHWFMGRALPLRNADGRIMRWFGTLTDIDETRRAASERDALLTQLAEQKSHLATLVEMAPVGIVMVEAPSGRVMGGNRRAEEIFGHPILASKSVEAYDEWIAFHADGRRVESHEYPAARVLREGVARAELEVHYQRGDGRRVWVRLVAAPLRVPLDGAMTAVVAVSLDVDAERRAIEALREADRRKNDFLAMLAHELRNPLAPITNAVKLLEREPALTVAGSRAVEMIERQARHMRRLIEDLLEVSRITRGTVQLKLEPIVLGSLVCSVVEAALPAADAKGQQLRTALPVTAVRLLADPVRVAQVLENLVGNAIKYTPEGGRIDVELRDLADAAELRVADDGIGIAPDKLESVFELFVQGDPGIGPHQGGLGIGLAMVKRLVELHGGSVRAESAGRDQGSTFIVRLPRQQRT